METELEEELRLIRPIASTRQRVSALARENSPALFLSDTYFSSAQVEALLTQCGYPKPLDIVASCEELKSKFAGTLFGHVARQRGFQSAFFQHLGDNVVSDLQNARASGWNAQIFADSHWTTRERVLFASGNGDFLSSAIAGSARAARLGQEDPVKEGILTAAASVVGPLFAAYVLWILLDVQARGGCTTIHFLARDGQLMVPICQRLARWLLGSDPAPEPETPELHLVLPRPVPIFLTYLTLKLDGETPTLIADAYGRDVAGDGGSSVAQ